MKPNPDFLLDRLDSFREALVVLAKTKPGDKTTQGTEREMFVSFLLSQLLPPQYRIGSGMIYDAKGYHSTQLDVVIELPFTPSFSFLSDNPRMYPADTIGAVIEIKSNKDQWKNVSEKFVKGSRGKSYCPLVNITRSVVVIEKPSSDKSDSDDKKTPATPHARISKTIPSYVVFYYWEQLERETVSVELRKKLNGLNSIRNIVRGILTLNPPNFVGSDGSHYEGKKALGAFINSIHWELHRTSPLSWPDLPAYFGLRPDPDSTT